MSRRPCIAIALTAALLTGAAFAADPSKPKADVDPLWPTNMAPHNWHTNPGTRYQMRDFVKIVDPARVIIRAKIADWRNDHMGTLRVGDQHHFSAILADPASKKWGSVKEGTDGGKLTTTVYWMDGKGKVAKVDPGIIKGGCVCSGVYSLYLAIPSWSATARHRLNFHYVNKRLKMDVTKDIYFNVVNDGSWKVRPLLERLEKAHPSVTTLQNGVPCPQLDITGYKGAADTYMHATHNVKDRNSDFVNYGAVTQLQIGTYGQAKRVLIRFDLHNVPAASPVKEAYLQLYSHAGPGRRPSGPAIAAYDVLKPWGAGKAMGNRWRKPYVLPGDATWVCNQHPTKWDSPGCSTPGKDRSAKPVGSAEKPKGFKNWVTVKLDPKFVQRWIDEPKTNRGVMLMDAKEGVKGGGAAYYRACDFEDPNMRPRLVLAFGKKVTPAGKCTPDGCPMP